MKMGVGISYGFDLAPLFSMGRNLSCEPRFRYTLISRQNLDVIRRNTISSAITDPTSSRTSSRAVSPRLRDGATSRPHGDRLLVRTANAGR